MYREMILDLYKHPLNFGELKSHTHSGKKQNPSCGDGFELQLIVDAHQKITDVKFTGSGCAISTASCSLLTEKIKGMNISDAKKLTFEDMQKELGVQISAGRVQCATLGIDILRLL